LGIAQFVNQGDPLGDLLTVALAMVVLAESGHLEKGRTRLAALAHVTASMAPAAV
jgi:hypothetical protein